MSQAVNTIGNIYADHHQWLLRGVKRNLSCRELAADLTHDTFLKLITRGESPEQIREPRAYLTKIARRLIANHWRRCDIERAYLSALQDRDEAYEGSPEQRHMVIESLCYIDQVLQKLPTKVRQAFIMSRLDGIKYAQIALSLGVSERMVKKYMASAMLACLSLDAELQA